MRDTLEHYVRDLRRGLRGIPRPDVDDIVREIRSHVEEIVAEDGSIDMALQGLGPAEKVASEVIEKRVRRGDGDILREASPGRRVVAWLADVTLGWGPFIANPAWMAILGFVQVRYWMTEEARQRLSRMPEFVMPSFPTAALLVLALCAAWGLFYWIVLRRSRSASVGMRLAGVSRVAASNGVIVLRTTDIAESEPARIVARPKWYLAIPVVPLTGIVGFLILYIGVMTVGSFFQPFNRWLPQETGDNGTSQAVVSVFYDAVLEGDADEAERYLSDDSTLDIGAFISDRQVDGLESWTLGGGDPADYYYVVERLETGKERYVLVLLERIEEQVAPGEISVKYRVRDCSDTPLAVDKENPE